MPWLRKEITDELDALGYVAIPKDRIERIGVEKPVDLYETAHFRDEPGFKDMIQRDLGHQIGMYLLRHSFLALEAATSDRANLIMYRGSARFIRPMLEPPCE